MNSARSRPAKLFVIIAVTGLLALITFQSCRAPESGKRLGAVIGLMECAEHAATPEELIAQVRDRIGDIAPLDDPTLFEVTAGEHFLVALPSEHPADLTFEVISCNRPKVPPLIS